jgi:heptosyltransferase-2
VKVLIWQTAYLGDVVLTTPLIRSVLASFPDAEVTFVGRPFCRELLGGWDRVRVVPFSKGFWESFRIATRIRGHDVALVPHRSFRTAFIVLASRIPLRVGFRRSEFPPAFNVLVDHRWEEHEVDRNLRLLEPLGAPRVVRDPWLPLRSRERVRILEKFGLREGDYVVVNPFSNFPLKEWYLEGWARVIEGLGRNLRVVVTGLGDDAGKVEKLRGSADFVNLVGRTSLRELMGVIAGSRGVVSNDSSPVHIANALGVPAVTVYTSTSPDYGFYPLRGAYVRNPSPCSPCSPNPKRCRTGTLECLRSVSPDLVLEVCQKTFKV